MNHFHAARTQWETLAFDTILVRNAGMGGVLGFPNDFEIGYRWWSKLVFRVMMS